MCRNCSSTFPVKHLIPGNGPRKDICWHCAGLLGIISKDEIETNLFSNTEQRTQLLARRLSPWLWLVMVWLMYIIVLNSVEPFGTINLIVAILSSLFVPIRQWLTLPRFKSRFSKLEPKNDTR